MRSHDTSTEQEEEDEMDDIDGDDETIFKHKVEKMRPQSTIFLQMLNDMRRRSKELPQGSPAEEQYRYQTNFFYKIIRCSQSSPLYAYLFMCKKSASS